MAPGAYTAMGDNARALSATALTVLRSPDNTKKGYYGCWSPTFTAFGGPFQVERQDSLTVFKFTEAAQARLQDLLTRRKDGALTPRSRPISMPWPNSIYFYLY